MTTTRRFFALLLALAMLAVACGEDREEDAADDTTETTAEDGGGSSDGPQPFGDLESPCGDGDASGATDQGVTDDAIRIGYGDDAGFAASPGLNHEMTDAVKAFVDWCNDQGGINGRRIEGTYYDAKITEVVNVMTEACAKEFMLVGQGFALDASQEKARRECELPSVPGFAVSPQHANGPLKFEPLPVPGDYTVISHGQHLKDLFPEKIERSGVLYANYSATIDSKDKVVPGFSSLGYEFLCEVQYNIQGEADWKPLVQKLKDCGAEMVYFVGSPNPNFRNVLEAADQLEFRPVWWGDPNLYDQNFAKWNTSGFGDQVYFRSAFTPLEEASENEATQQYIDIVEGSGGDLGLLGQQAASAFLLWATAAKACGSELTRECVIEELSDTHEWTAGGFQAPADPGANTPTECGVLLKMEGTGFERVFPKEPNTFDCDPKYAYEVTGAPVQRAKIGSDRIAEL
jgi:ABC-type branched-subunit amino acid transport system substrate-binding protein